MRARAPVIATAVAIVCQKAPPARTTILAIGHAQGATLAATAAMTAREFAYFWCKLAPPETSRQGAIRIRGKLTLHPRSGA